MKSPAPLLSLNPSGTFAGLITASIWKGRNYIRQRVDPSNPRTAGQLETRLAVGAVAKSASIVLTSTKDVDNDIGSVFFETARDAAPSGQSWISFYQKYASKDISDMETAWTALGGTKQGYFTTTAAADGLVDYVPSNGAGTIVAGKQLLLLARFASLHLTGAANSGADTAIAGASQNDVDDFGDLVIVSND